MNDFLGFVGIGILFALFCHGWPSFITIHKHYYGKDGGEETNE